MNIVDLILLKYPGISLIKDVELSMGEDGVIFINKWNLDAPKPTDEDIALWLEDNALITQKVLTEAITQLDDYINKKAKERNYNDAMSLVSYKDSTNPQWAAEATAFIEWRDQVWALAIQTEKDVLDGKAQLTTLDDFIAGLPALTWP